MKQREVAWNKQAWIWITDYIVVCLRESFRVVLRVNSIKLRMIKRK